MRWNVVTGSAVVLGIALVALLAGQYSTPPERFDFDKFEGEKRAAQPLIDRAKRAEAAPPVPSEQIQAGELEQGIRGSVVGYGLTGAARR